MTHCWKHPMSPIHLNKSKNQSRHQVLQCTRRSVPLRIISYFPSTRFIPPQWACSVLWIYQPPFQPQSFCGCCALRLKCSSKRYLQGLPATFLQSFIQRSPLTDGFPDSLYLKLQTDFSHSDSITFPELFFLPSTYLKYIRIYLLTYWYSLLLSMPSTRDTLQENKLFYRLWLLMYP